ARPRRAWCVPVIAGFASTLSFHPRTWEPSLRPAPPLMRRVLGPHRVTFRPMLSRVRTSTDTSLSDSVAKFDFWGTIQKSGVKNSMTYRLTNSRKSNFATEPFFPHAQLQVPQEEMRQH